MRFALILLLGATPALAQTNRHLPLDAQLKRCRAAMEEVSDSLLNVSSATLAAAHQSKNPVALAHAYACRGFALDNMLGDQAPALAYYDSAIAAGQKLHNDTVLADAHVGRGELHYTRGDFLTSISDLTLAYRLYTRMAMPYWQPYALTALGNLYADSRVAQYDKALEYFRQVLAVHVKSDNKGEIAATYFNIAGTLERKEKNEEALSYYKRALAIDAQLGDPDEVAYDKRAIAVVLYHLNRPAEALKYVDDALTQFNKSGNPMWIAMGQMTRGIALRNLKRYPEAIKELTAARVHFTRNESNRYLEWTNEQLSLSYAALGDWARAYQAHVALLDVQKKLNQQALDERTARMRVLFDAEKKERDNQALIRENAANARVRELQLAVLSLSTLIIAVLAIFVLRQIKNARRLRITAMTDDLTSLPNRRHLLHVANERFHFARSNGGHMGVLGIDIDHFKQINDTYGHAVGDATLKRIAQVLQNTLRGADLVGRVGGDEFVVIMPGATKAVTDDVANRIHDAIGAAEFTDIHPDLLVSLCIGGAVIKDGDGSVTEIMKRADESLYEAKHGRRNRIGVAAN
ncbi:MAG TPA: tetratricopeptide repeat-containing diguanylate cyclase [Longimicrobiales bacterium]|nr:tetratricopeptide repeat-containing diguanylate cyclase [Longimicrobiales bacterium]